MSEQHLVVATPNPFGRVTRSADKGAFGSRYCANQKPQKRALMARGHSNRTSCRTEGNRRFVASASASGAIHEVFKSTFFLGMWAFWDSLGRSDFLGTTSRTSNKVGGCAKEVRARSARAVGRSENDMVWAKTKKGSRMVPKDGDCESGLRRRVGVLLQIRADPRQWGKCPSLYATFRCNTRNVWNPFVLSLLIAFWALLLNVKSPTKNFKRSTKSLQLSNKTAFRMNVPKWRRDACKPSRDTVNYGKRFRKTWKTGAWDPNKSWKS